MNGVALGVSLHIHQPLQYLPLSSEMLSIKKKKLYGFSPSPDCALVKDRFPLFHPQHVPGIIAPLSAVFSSGLLYPSFFHLFFCLLSLHLQYCFRETSKDKPTICHFPSKDLTGCCARCKILTLVLNCHVGVDP